MKLRFDMRWTRVITIPLFLIGVLSLWSAVGLCTLAGDDAMADDPETEIRKMINKRKGRI